MHEYSIASALLRAVEAAAAEQGAVRVTRLFVRLGAFAGVEPALLETAFRLCAVSDLTRGAALEIERVEPHWSCPVCEAPRAPDGPPRCLACDRPLRLVRGHELALDRVELEVKRV